MVISRLCSYDHHLALLLSLQSISRICFRFHHFSFKLSVSRSSTGLPAFQSPYRHARLHCACANWHPRANRPRGHSCWSSYNFNRGLLKYLGTIFKQSTAIPWSTGHLARNDSYIASIYRWMAQRSSSFFGDSTMQMQRARRGDLKVNDVRFFKVFLPRQNNFYVVGTPTYQGISSLASRATRIFKA